MNWKVENFQVPNHPNWTGKAHRTSEEAFKGFKFQGSFEGPSRGWGGVVIGILLVLVALAGFIPRTGQAAPIDYAERSLNKTIIVEKGSTSTRYESGGGTQVETRKTRKVSKK